MQRSEQDPDRLAKLEVINGECERLAYLVEDLLELSRAQVGELRVSAERFELRRCVEDVVDGLRTVAEHREVGVEVVWDGAPAQVLGDENRVRQILANLLTNGIKYAPPETVVTVRGDSTGDMLRVAVEDRGRGIAECDLPHIFDEFFQARDRAEPGAGLGLAIARELAEAHGGRIDVLSGRGSGTCFTLSLPAWRES